MLPRPADLEASGLTFFSLSAVLLVGLVTWLTRGLHLNGLANYLWIPACAGMTAVMLGEEFKNCDLSTRCPVSLE